ncbi:hypothetical protein H9P43_005345 [Blastocladiella emersonii ATCC 22665]|nr:hypothetical protein H9P43_005345 [Blastocladiella emersonii ATCC 22665]
MSVPLPIIPPGHDPPPAAVSAAPPALSVATTSPAATGTAGAVNPLGSPPKSPVPGSPGLNFAKLAMQRNYSNEFPPAPPASSGPSASPTGGTGSSGLRNGTVPVVHHSSSAGSLPSVGSSSPASVHSIESAPEISSGSSPLVPPALTLSGVFGTGGGGPPSPFSPPPTLPPSALGGASGTMSLAEFMRDDRFPRRQRKYFLALQRLEETYSPDAKLQPIKVKKDKKSSSSDGSGSGAMNKLSNLLGKKKNRQKTVNSQFHMLRIAIMEERQDTAIDVLEQLPSATIKKKRPDEVNHLFLLALAKRMERLCMKMFDKGYPADVNAPIFLPNVTKGEAPKFGFPSFFLLAIGFGLNNLATAMMKKANVQQSWYGLTPLLLACSGGTSGRASLGLVTQLLAMGANPAAGIPLEQYQVHKKLRPKPARIRTMPHHQANGSDFGAYSPMPATVPAGISRAASFADGSFGGAVTTSICPLGQYGQAAGAAVLETPERVGAWSKGKMVYPLDVAAAAEQGEVLQLLLRKLEQRRVRDSALCFLAQQNFAVTMQLWKNGGNAMQRDWGQMTGLHIASRLGLIELVYVYLEMRVDANTPGENGWTPLQEAVSQRHRDTARMLSRRGARADDRNQAGDSAHDVARRVGLSPAEAAEYFATDATPEEAARDAAIAERVAAALMNSPVHSVAGSADVLPGASGSIHSNLRIETGSVKSLRKRSESLPSYGAGSHATVLASSGLPSPLSDSSSASSGGSSGSPTGHHGHHARATSDAAAHSGIAGKTKKKRSGTMDKFAMLRQSMFSSSSSSSNAAAAASSASELPPMPRSSSMHAAPPVPPKIGAGNASSVSAAAAAMAEAPPRIRSASAKN